MKELLSGNEAIARGAYEAGVKVGVGYPGTPSTEVLENLRKFNEVYAEWSPNEKVAFEVGVGASVMGARTIVTMKHVGVNVAADPLMSFAYAGVNGGFILYSADDPGMHSSQNEQDNRILGKFAKIPVVEPSDSQEAKDFVAIAFDISESYDTPVMLRTTTRIAHSQSMVELGTRQDVPLKEYVKNAPKNVMIPAYGRARRLVVEERMGKLAEYAAATPLNRVEWGNKEFGIITSGVCYQYVKEAFPEASILKLGLTFPLNEQYIADFVNQVDRVFVVEELEPFLEEAITLMGFEVTGKKLFPNIGELNATMVKSKINQELKLGLDEPELIATSDLPSAPMRPPVLCAGCPHRAVFHVLRKLKLTVTGDIGCYTLGASAPLEAIDTTICMGASIGMALGMEKANPDMIGKIVAVIGDSTFFHSGITGLVDMVYNDSKGTVIILDNSTTAMTGHQDNPSTGKNIKGEVATVVNIADVARGVGVRRVVTVDPFEIDKLEQILKEELAAPEPSVIIAKSPCVLLGLPETNKEPLQILEDKCKNCKACVTIGCPPIAVGENTVTLDSKSCNGCNLCAQLCKFGAIVKAGEGNE
ncbi:MAG: indolepyruvate ferredoxin oxidoreductase subunit alpha [Peptococcia bacterium]